MHSPYLEETNSSSSSSETVRNVSMPTENGWHQRLQSAEIITHIDLHDSLVLPSQIRKLRLKVSRKRRKVIIE